MVSARATIVTLLCILSTACGGGGGGSDPAPPPAPTATLTASPTSVTSGGTTTLTWSSTNANTCTASGGWTGARATSGTEPSAALTASATFTLTCGSASASATVTVTAPPTVSVSGNLLIPENVQTDGDTNDSSPNYAAVANNTFAAAQSLPNPVVVGGYVTRPGAGSSGPLQTNGDVNDVYSVSLLAGQVIELTVANPNPDSNDLDLELYTEGQVKIDESIGVSRVERIDVATSGRYFVRVLAYEGASNYLLSIGQTGSGNYVPSLSLRREFVPNELLVKMRDTQDSGAMEKAAAPLSLKVARATAGSYSLVRLDAESHEKVEQVRSASKVQGERFIDEHTRLKSATLHAIKELSKRADVEWVEPNWIWRAQATPNDPLYARQRWHYEQMQLPSAWDVTTGSTNVIAAVIDSGVRPHPELQPRFVDPYDFVSNDTDASDPGNAQGGNYYFHGTHVAGTIGAMGNNAQGATGVAWTVGIMPVRVLGEQGQGTFDDIMQGVRYAAGLSNRSGRVPQRRADVINLSLGGEGTCPQAIQQVFAEVRAAGTIVVAAAGNSNTSTPSVPASCDNVISVSSVDASRSRAPYSNYGTTVDVAAPGGDTSEDRNGDGYEDGVYSTHATRQGTTYQSSYTYMQGTSMAAPHVAGVIALMKSVNNALTPAQVDTLLANGSLTDDIGPAGRDDLGIGLINALKAVRAAGGNVPPAPARLDVVPSSLNFGNTTTSNDVRVTNGGTGTLAVTGTSVSAAWLTVGPVAVDANGFGQYRIQVNRVGLAAGTYNGWVQFASAAGAQRVTVLMQVGNAGGGEPNAGQHYLLLLDAATGQPMHQVEVLARGPSVAFNFPSVTPGQYELAVGTDANNDNLICDDGEACGQYPVYGEPTIITVNAAVTGLDLVTSYHTDVAPSMARAAANESTDERGRGIRRLR